MIRPFLPALLGLSLAGCANKDAVQECSETEPCDDFANCVDGRCERRMCSTSADCGMEAFCASDGRCEGGCQGADDCYPGDVCAEGQCVSGGCRSTSLDCGFNEFCDTTTGDCYEAGGYYCEPCTQESDCGGNGNLCLNLGGGYGSFCGVTCESEGDCPSGYTCNPIGDEFGNVFTYQCITYCWLYIDDAEGPPGPAAGPAAQESCL